ncbi:hypothetical protein [Nocardia sp. NPDC052566]|uniref:hypothetical protein n=1 Tax=Nocardia sp. NPDC052566 TaxID=3364330 RepID=UPI0037C8582B
MTDRLVDFVGRPRGYGINAGSSETIDVAGVVIALGLSDRNRPRTGPAAMSVRRKGRRAAFDQLFDLHFLGAERYLAGMPVESGVALQDQLVDVATRGVGGFGSRAGAMGQREIIDAAAAVVR